MTFDCNKLLRKGHFCCSAVHGAARIIRRCYNNDFISGEFESNREPKVPENEVNKRLTGQEVAYAGSKDHIIFSANQVGVNRPVEDRWIAYQFGLLASTVLTSPRISNSLRKDYGGTVFSVIDGHGGHACAHAVNLLHSDYLVAGLLPPECCEQALAELRTIEETHAPYSACELSEVLWSRPETSMTRESEYIGYPRKSIKKTNRPPYRWAPWGPWGPLASSVRDVHIKHLRKFLEESLSCSLERDENGFNDNEAGDICDQEGFVVAPVSALHEAVRRVDPANSKRLAQSEDLSFSNLSPSSKEKFVRLHDRAACLSKTLRNSLERMDIDLSIAAQPSNRGPTLDRALLRIVFSGCVGTTAFVPSSSKELYVCQVGDCGAVLGKFEPENHQLTTGCLDPGTYSPADWKAELLVSPHNAENSLEVQRLKSCHPTTEAPFILVDDRLLGELMPLRAFGDIRFKWPLDELKYVARLLDLPPNYPITSSFYETPPYLIATPQVAWRPLLERRDHFLILATDGLWDMITPQEAVEVVARHWFDYHRDPSVCGPGDTAASRLIRTALGGETMDPERISSHFSLPATVARYYRDDITVIVAYLPTAFAKSS
ncbi:unnamed protein product [Calicophoron daubneyi]|uniref:PPM-type phosphatase domain-containing protein n=1 Tax=Calicophoron daubneyi TaxID=300641 RepID=A0AAV2TJ18_CALDB